MPDTLRKLVPYTDTDVPPCIGPFVGKMLAMVGLGMMRSGIGIDDELVAPQP